MLRVRSALFSVLLVSGVFVYAPIMLLLFFLPFRLRYRLIIQFTRYHNWLLRTLCGLGFQIEGREHIPTGACIILSKHQSAWETLAFGAIFPPHAHVLKRELLHIPLFGWALALLKPIALNRGSPLKALEQLVTQGQDRLRTGLCVLVFPEGTRIAPKTRTRFKIGGAVLAARTGFPVVPVAHNAGMFWPRRGFIKRPGTIQIRIGAPIASADKSPEQINQLAQSWIEEQMCLLESRMKTNSLPNSSGDS